MVCGQTVAWLALRALWSGSGVASPSGAEDKQSNWPQLTEFIKLKTHSFIEFIFLQVTVQKYKSTMYIRVTLY
jgi:hypothetical protein